MKLFRFGERGREKPGILLDSGEFLDVSAFGRDYDDDFFRYDSFAELMAWVRDHREGVTTLEPGSFRFAPVVRRPSKIVCVGLNYRAHAAETGAALPREPKLFMKATTAIAGVFDELELPRGSQKTDYEVELGVVIGKESRYLDVDSARSAVFGYTIVNDYSEREFQKEREGQWVKGKSADGFAPIGPYLVPRDALSPDDLRLWLSVNGEMRQDGRTSDMVFNVAEIVASISQYMTLWPGDVISTGTPSGVGLGMSPPSFLRPGDVVRYGIEGIGEAMQTVIEPSRAG